MVISCTFDKTHCDGIRMNFCLSNISGNVTVFDLRYNKIILCSCIIIT